MDTQCHAEDAGGQRARWQFSFAGFAPLRALRERGWVDIQCHAEDAGGQRALGQFSFAGFAPLRALREKRG